MPAGTAAPSPRREELLDRSYRYVLANGLSDLSLRPLAAAVGSSPRVLLFLFGSKEELIRAVLQRARADEIARLEEARAADRGGSLADSVRSVWRWLADPAHRELLVLWLEVYARSLSDPGGPWSGFADQTVADWLALLEMEQPGSSTERNLVQRTLSLAVLRGALLDLLATGDGGRASAAVDLYVQSIMPPSPAERLGNPRA